MNPTESSTGKKRLLIATVVLMLLVGAVLFVVLKPEPEALAELRVSGTIEVTQVVLSFKIPGRLSERLVDEGMPVRSGQLVARLDASDQELLVRQASEQLGYAQALLAEIEAGSRGQEILAAEAELERARAGLMAAQSRLELAVADHDRFSRLSELGVVSPREYEAQKAQRDIAQTAVNEALARVDGVTQQLSLIREGPRPERIEQARTQVGIARESLEKAKLNLGYTELRAPLDGVILCQGAEPGEYLNPGSPVLTLGQMEKVWLRAYVNETDLGKVKLGQEVTVSTDTYPGETFPGRISFIASEAEFTPKFVQTHEERVKLVYRVKVELDNPDMILKPGMPADALIALSP